MGRSREALYPYYQTSRGSFKGFPSFLNCHLNRYIACYIVRVVIIKHKKGCRPDEGLKRCALKPEEILAGRPGMNKMVCMPWGVEFDKVILKGTPMNLPQRIEEMSETVLDSANREVRVLKEEQARGLEKEGLGTVRTIYLAAMKTGVCPYRYIRNRDVISISDQIVLAESCVAVVGAGGLGGHVILHLARSGIGCLKVADYDSFDETNLNRQALSEPSVLEVSKSDTAAQRVSSINPAVDVLPFSRKIDPDNAAEILGDSDVIVDALDNISDRFVIEKAAGDLGIPLVHGAIAGFEGQMMTILPGDKGLQQLYGKKPPEKKNPLAPEAILGVPALTPALISTFQAMEVIKIILNRGTLFRNRMMHVDLEAGVLDVFKF
jgi:molybdopterin/thiamine biosynthesis adenylyltransferase